jgi:flagellar motility protein MotE (MotC chaperone)
MKKEKKSDSKESPEQVSSAEALQRMKRFIDRKEQFVNVVKKGKDRGLPAR